MNICVRCGAELVPHVRVCSYCGYPVNPQNPESDMFQPPANTSDFEPSQAPFVPVPKDYQLYNKYGVPDKKKTKKMRRRKNRSVPPVDPAKRRTVRKRVLAALAAAVFLFSALLSGWVFSVRKNANTDGYAGVSVRSGAGNNEVAFRESVSVNYESDTMSKAFKSVRNTEEGVCLQFKTLPAFFESMKSGEVFCVYPSEDSTDPVFGMGFCGKLIRTEQSGDGSEVHFSIPALTEVFSKMSLNNAAGTGLTGVSFLPEEGVEVLGYTPYSAAPLSSTLDAGVSFGLKNNTYTLNLVENKKPAINGYTILCEQLKLSMKNMDTSSELVNLSTNGTVTLEYPAIKYNIDWEASEEEDSITIHSMNFDFVCEYSADLRVKGSKGHSFDSDKARKPLDKAIRSVIDIRDEVSSQKGKIVLGSYLFGTQVSLPVTYNTANKVNYLSVGILVQLTETFTGELSLEYSLSQSGVANVRMDDSGNVTGRALGPDFPNPAYNKINPTESQLHSLPVSSASVTGHIQCTAAFGVDIGICLLGTVPIKIATNLVQLDIEGMRTVTTQESKEEDKLLVNGFPLDCKNYDFVQLSTNAVFRVAFGGEIKFEKIRKNAKYTLTDLALDIQLMDIVLFQYPSPLDFDQSQCSFGGIMLGETYTDSELKNAYKAFQTDTEQSSVINDLKDSLFAGIISRVSSEFGLENFNIEDSLPENLADHKIDAFTGGVLYVRDKNDVVVSILVFGDRICNISGFQVGLTEFQTKQIYSNPHTKTSASIKLSALMKRFLKMSGQDYLLKSDGLSASVYRYNSKDSDAQMTLLYGKETLFLILLSEK